jgi:hypothetical protein
MVLGGEESELTHGIPPAKPCGSSVGTEPLDFESNFRNWNLIRRDSVRGSPQNPPLGPY